MTNKEIAKAFANGATKGKSNSMFIDGNTIYSYSYHFPIARRIEDRAIVFNIDKYSRTTSTHQGQVKRALECEGYKFYDSNTDLIIAYLVDFNKEVLLCL